MIENLTILLQCFGVNDKNWSHKYDKFLKKYERALITFCDRDILTRLIEQLISHRGR